MVAEVAAREDVGLDAANGADEDGLDTGFGLPERAGDRQGGHEVSSCPASGNEDAPHLRVIPSAARDLAPCPAAAPSSPASAVRAALAASRC